MLVPLLLFVFAFTVSYALIVQRKNPLKLLTPLWVVFFCGCIFAHLQSIQFLLQIMLSLLSVVFFYSVVAGSNSAGNLSKDFPLQFRLAAQFRTTVLMFFVVPLSYFLRQRTAFLIWYHSLTPVQSVAHEEHLASVVQQVKSWNDAGRKCTLRTARPNWRSMSTKLSSNKQDSSKIQFGQMNAILEVDTENMTLTAEPGVTMGQLTHHLLPLGLALEIQVSRILSQAILL
jgi:hypothetical protein